jgi:hypothetical protein
MPRLVRKFNNSDGIQIQPITTKQTTTSSLKSLNIEKDQYI